MDQNEEDTRKIYEWGVENNVGTFYKQVVNILKCEVL